MPDPPTIHAQEKLVPAPCNSQLLAALAGEVMERCDQAALFSEHPSQITRTFCSSAMAGCHSAMRSWMKQAGMHCRMDAAGNLIGRWEGEGRTTAPVLMIGSHLDTVPNGGRYDGILGVLLAVALVKALGQCSQRLPFAIEIVGFSEEEGVRYAVPYLGSSAMTGVLDKSLLDRRDGEGITLAEALHAFGGLPESLDTAAIDAAGVVAFLEPHIEQGPVLQEKGLALGCVSAIAGQTRLEVRFEGAAGHAGTTPMHLRRDAVTASAEWILDVERAGRATSGMVATVGVVEVTPNVANVIPGEARLRLDLRHAEDAVREKAIEELLQRGREIAARRRLSFEWTTRSVQKATAMDNALTAVLQQSLEDAGVHPLKLTSGAGHDSAVMAAHVPTAMLFIRCRDGVSHHPDESVEVGDVALALTAMWHFVQRLALHAFSGLEPE